MPARQPKTPSCSQTTNPSPCDPQLPLRALEHRINHQLMSASDFSRYNVSVWLLQDKSGRVEYLASHNETIKELERKRPPRSDNPAKVGYHAEALIGEQVYRRLDVLKGETLVRQIFTERIPCSECHNLLSRIPHFRNVPRYFYLIYPDKEWQEKQAGGSWGAFLMDCYRLR